MAQGIHWAETRGLDGGIHTENAAQYNGKGDQSQQRGERDGHTHTEGLQSDPAPSSAQQDAG